MTTDVRQITIKQGKLYLSAELYNTYFAGRETAALIEKDGKLLLLPIFSEAQGGLLIKVINARGDRLVDAVDMLRRMNLDFDTMSCNIAWSTDLAGLFIELPKAYPAGPTSEAP
jgi:hypothetical protein